MVIQKRYCDRCRKEISENCEQISLGIDINYDLCDDCYEDVSYIIADWIEPCQFCKFGGDMTVLRCRRGECDPNNGYKNFEKKEEEE